MNGLLLVNKQKGMSSHDVVQSIKSTLGAKKAGHTGTLDPLAEGLLLICVNRATKLTPFLQNLDKVYQGKMTFGAVTSTLDGEGEILEEKDASSLKRQDVERIFQRFTGKILQIPPAHSALHKEGKRLYDLAREGVEVKVPPREVEIHELQLLDFSPGSHPWAEFKLRCSKGTYVRSLCRDIGEVSEYGAYQSSLCRTRVGPFRLQDASTCKEIEKIKENEQVEKVILPLSKSLPHLPKVLVKKEAEKLVKWGRPLYLTHISQLPPGLEKGDRVTLCSKQGDLLAVAVSLQSGLHFVKDHVGFKYLRVFAR